MWAFHGARSNGSDITPRHVEFHVHLGYRCPGHRLRAWRRIAEGCQAWRAFEARFAFDDDKAHDLRVTAARA